MRKLPWYGMLVLLCGIGLASGPVIAQDPPNPAPQIQVLIGTIPAGKSLSVFYDVTVNSPFPVGLGQVATQSVLSGGNFAPVLSDDPDTPDANDPTVTQVVAQVIVSKQYSDGNTAPVNVLLDCGDATVIPINPVATPGGSGAVFEVSNFDQATECNATEDPVPTGYTPQYANCSLLTFDGTSPVLCTLGNTQNAVEVVIAKTYTVAHPVSDPEVQITLFCDNATVSLINPDQIDANPGADGTNSVLGQATASTNGKQATFWVSNFPPQGAGCFATEQVPAGYQQDNSTCGTDIGPGRGFTVTPGANLTEPVACTITNRPTEALFTVGKTFSDGNPDAGVLVTPSCDNGSLIVDTNPPDGMAKENTDVAFTVRYFTPGASCTATEEDIIGYYQDVAVDDCSVPQPIADDGGDNSCEFLNIQETVEVTVRKDFSDDNPAPVTMNLTCTGGLNGPTVITPPSAPAIDGGDPDASPAVFTVSNIRPDGTTDCTATEDLGAAGDDIPGYTPLSTTCTVTDIPLGSPGVSCTITNIQDPVQVVVAKAYTEVHPLPGLDPEVSITLVCEGATVGLVNPNDLPGGAEGVNGPAISTMATTTTVGKNATFWVSNFPYGGTGCYATEEIPAGYVQDNSTCGTDTGFDRGLTVIPGANLSNPVACTITNRPNAAVLTVDKQFSDGNPQLAVDVTPLCTDAGGGPGITYTPETGQAWQGTDFETIVKYFTTGTVCEASDDPLGYTQAAPPTGADCAVGVAVDDTNDGSCVLYNQQDPVTIVASKAYGGAGGPAATFAAACDGPNTMVAPAGGLASPGNPLNIVVSNFPWDGTNCNVTEPVPPSGYYETDSSCNGLTITPSDDDTLCTITNAPTIARFQVTKNFLDGNHNTPVDVTLSCFTGLPLVQTQTITESQGVNFVVEDFDHLQLDCTVTEETVPGYAPTYTASGTSADGNVGGCQFENVGGGEQNFCQVDNYAKPVDVVIEKVWVIEGSGGDFVDTRYKLALRCDGEIAKGEPCDGYYPSGLDAADNHLSTDWCRNFKSDTDNEWIAKVTPRYPATTCTVTETIYDDAVETDMGECPEMVIKANQGASCLVTNTVFFEGIPTLSQYGLAILALLMLGVGMVGFRRFA